MTVPREIAWMLAPLRREPRDDAALDTEALRGEAVTVDPGSARDGWIRARLDADGYEGWLPEGSVAETAKPATHRVRVPRTLAFPAPDIKRPPVAALLAGSRVRIVREEGRFAVTDGGEWIIAEHLEAPEARAADLVTTAEAFLHTPYLWGGKSAQGIDCSGLVQLSALLCGVAAPRDSGPQEQALGEAVDSAPEAFARGDLLFWPGHVALARGDGTIIHANAHHMMVAVEPVAEALRRTAARGTPLRSVRRLRPQ